MFKFVDKPDPVVVHAWPCVISLPRDGGSTVKAKCSLDFELIDQDQIDELLLEGGDRALLDRVVVGWSADVVGEDNQPLAFNAENKAKLLRIPYVRGGWVRAFFDAAAGRAAARKN